MQQYLQFMPPNHPAHMLKPGMAPQQAMPGQQAQQQKMPLPMLPMPPLMGPAPILPQQAQHMQNTPPHPLMQQMMQQQQQMP
jgi:hypothetical protein